MFTFAVIDEDVGYIVVVIVDDDVQTTITTVHVLLKATVGKILKEMLYN